jgi:hypothetical protein
MNAKQKEIAIRAALYTAGWAPGTSAREIRDQDPGFESLIGAAQYFLEVMGRPGTIEALDIIEAL